MKVLLDTHAFLWFILDDPRLSVIAREVIVEPRNAVLVSPASYWEIAIKIRLNKYDLPGPYLPFMEKQLAINDFTILSVELRHTAVVTTLPLHHKDPFDRLLVAQALAEAIPILSADAALDAYGVTRLW